MDVDEQPSSSATSTVAAVAVAMDATPSHVAVDSNGVVEDGEVAAAAVELANGAAAVEPTNGAAPAAAETTTKVAQSSSSSSSKHHKHSSSSSSSSRDKKRDSRDNKDRSSNSSRDKDKDRHSDRRDRDKEDRERRDNEDRERREKNDKDRREREDKERRERREREKEREGRHKERDDRHRDPKTRKDEDGQKKPTRVDDDDDEEYRKRVEQQLKEKEEEERRLEESRKRREEILRKHRLQQQAQTGAGAGGDLGSPATTTLQSPGLTAVGSPATTTTTITPSTATPMQVDQANVKSSGAGGVAAISSASSSPASASAPATSALAKAFAQAGSQPSVNNRSDQTPAKAAGGSRVLASAASGTTAQESRSEATSEMLLQGEDDRDRKAPQLSDKKVNWATVSDDEDDEPDDGKRKKARTAAAAEDGEDGDDNDDESDNMAVVSDMFAEPDKIFAIPRPKSAASASAGASPITSTGPPVAAAGNPPRPSSSLRYPVSVDDDIFAPQPAKEVDMFAQYNSDAKLVQIKPTISTTFSTAADTNPSLTDNWDDEEGYYRLRVGEVIDNRYRITSNMGKGVFSTVVRAVDIAENNGEVAIKIIRNNETMYKAGLKEATILRKLNDTDPPDRRHIIRLLRQFVHRNHLCLVFESLSMNLREVVARYGKEVGLNIKAVRLYAHHLFLALSHLRKCGVLHADIKPDNILVSENKNVLKVCDLGSASWATENEITPYLVSRFYRPPEVVLGLPYDYGMDMWSVGCTLYEIYTGKILFPGKRNNDMLRMFQEVKGKFSNKIIRKGAFSSQHFDENYNFRSIEFDKLRQKEVTRTVQYTQPTRDIKTLLMSSRAGTSEDDVRLLKHFIDLLENILTLNNEKRMTPEEALKHPFIRDPPPATKDAAGAKSGATAKDGAATVAGGAKPVPGSAASAAAAKTK